MISAQCSECQSEEVHPSGSNYDSLTWVTDMKSTFRGGVLEEIASALAPGTYGQDNMEVVNSEFAKFMVHFPEAHKRRPGRRVKLPKSNRQRKRVLYRLVQHGYRFNRARACRQIVSGEWKSQGQEPMVSLNDLEGFWRPLLETQSVRDDRDSTPVHKVALDGVTIPVLQKIPIAISGMPSICGFSQVVYRNSSVQAGQCWFRKLQAWVTQRNIAQ